MSGPLELDGLTGRSYAAVLFDMDGTLVDSTPAVERCWRRWGVEFGVPMDGFGGWHGMPARQVVATMLPPERVAAAVARIEELEISDTEGVVVLPGAAEALAALPAGRAAIATSCTRPLGEVRMLAAGLKAPDVVVFAGDTPIGKPDPAPYLLAAERLGVDPADCLVVEDAPAGLAAATAAGARSLAVLVTHEPGQLSAATAMVPDLSAVRFEVTREGVRLHPAG